MTYQNNSLMQALSELDDDIAKSQITQGQKPSPSERQSWAGSDWEQQSVPSHAPDGTNYVPRGAANKSVYQMTTAELEAHLQMRKSSTPNFAQAEMDILALDGVSKGICGVCGGYGHVGGRSCQSCGGNGSVFNFINKSMIPVAEQIADFYNCGPNSSLSKGFDSDSSLTPKNMPSYKDVGSGGESEMAKKGEFGAAGDFDEEDAVKGWSDDIKDKACKAMSLLKEITKGLDLEEDAEKAFGEMEEDASVADEVSKSMMKGMKALLKSQEAIMNQLDELEEKQKSFEGKQDKGNLVTSEMAKSFAGIPSQPIGAPRAVFTGAPQQVAVHQPPHAQQQTVQQQFGGAPTQSRYSRAQLMAGAEEMVQKSLMDVMQVVRMDSGSNLEPELIQQIESYLDQGARQQPVQGNPFYGQRG